MKRRRLWINIGLVAAIVVVGIGIGVVALRPQQAQAPERTVTVARATVVSSVTASGSVESAGDIDLNFGSTGVVTSVDVAAGDRVTKGQVLATIDSTTAEQQLATARANLAQAKSSALTSGASASNAQQQLALAKEAARASNESLDNAVTQAKSNLDSAEALWSDACTNPDDPSCPNPSAAEAIRTAKSTVSSAQLTYDKAVELAASNRAGYDLKVNQAGESLTAARSNATTVCDNSGSTSNNCSSANNQVITARQAYDTAVSQRNAGVLADNQAVEKASMSLSTANVALRKAVADQSKSASDAIRQAKQALTNAKSARDKGKVANAQSVQTAQNALASAQAAVTPLAAGSSPTDASVTSARAALAVAREAVANTRIVAPVDGTVGQINLTVGESSASPATSSSGSAAAVTVIPTGDYVATADFAESDAAQVNIGDPATVTFQALPGTSASGQVLSIDPMASTSATDNLVTFTIKVSIESVPQGVRPGMTASIAITTDEVADVLAIPQSAITSVGGIDTVQVLQADNTSVPAQVSIGVKGDSLTEITGGVAEGDVLVIPTAGAGLSQFPQGGVPGGGGPFGRPRG